MSGKGRKRKTWTAPIYAVGAVWLAFSLLWPPYGLFRLLAVSTLSAFAYFSVEAALRRKYGEYEDDAPAAAAAKTEKTVKAEQPKQTVSYGKEVDAILEEGKTAQKELGRLYASIPDPSVKKKIRDIMEVSDKIIQDAIDDPSDVPQIKKFLDYYLPTTIKLLNAYDRMGAQGIEGENISGTMSRIEDMLDTAIASYKKLLDGLFANQAMDIETDISVMNTLLKREGLSGASDF